MNRKKCVDVLGYIIVTGFCASLALIAMRETGKFSYEFELFMSVSYILVLVTASGLRVHMFYKIPKSERRIYKWVGVAGHFSFILHPVSQLGLVMVLALCLICSLSRGRPF